VVISNSFPDIYKIIIFVLMHRRSLLVWIAAFFITHLHAQVVINEVCTYNGSVALDEDGDAEDWLELYNTGPSPVSLNNYSLRSSQAGALEWQLPNVTIASQGYILVFISGKDRSAPVLHTSFKLSHQDESIILTDPSGAIASSLQIPFLQLDHSFGRYPDGSATLSYFTTPSAGSTNNTSPSYPGYTSKVIISVPQGFYTSGRLVSLSTSNTGASIRWTTDGSQPSISSSLYTQPIWIAGTTVLRAKAFENGKLPSATETRTFILDQTKLPVFSIATDPGNFFSQDSGIYVSGPNASPNYPYYGSNFWQPWERPIHLQYFDEKGKLRLEQDMGVQINGGSSSRSKPMKALRLVPREKYGDADISYRFFNDKNISNFKSLVLRNASGDFSKLHFRDGYVHSLVLDKKIDVDVLDYKPAVVYINGAYWGIHNIRERVSKDYLVENYHIDGNNVDILEEDTTIIEGDYTAFDAMEAFILNNDMSIAANFDSAAAMIDTKSLCDYFITETFFTNIDWPYNNLKYWRERKAGSKWRYILLDLDITMNNNAWAPASSTYLGAILGPFGDNNRHVQLFKRLLQNEEFHNYFINRYADLVNTAYSTPSLLAHFEKISGAIRDEMPRHMQRWWTPYSAWTDEADNLALPYLEQRPQYALDDVRDTFHLVKQVQLSLEAWPPEGGQIKLNTITPALPFTGTYFDGVPVSVTAIPSPGYKFQYWRSGNISSSSASSPSLVFNPDTNDVLTAYFVPADENNIMVVYPDPVDDYGQIRLVLNEDQAGSIEITDVQGRIIFKATQSFIQGVNFLNVPSQKLQKGIYLVRFSGTIETTYTKFVKQ
jgi:hypothetical protein